MLDSIWALLGNYGLDLQEISDAIHSLFGNTPAITDAEGNVIQEAGHSGSLAALADFPLIGMILSLFAGFAPAVETTLN
jgi:hypothetical protein